MSKIARAIDGRPTRRVVRGYQRDEYVVELTERRIRLRLLGSREKDRWVEIPADSLYVLLRGRD